jgi:hypothetical protein
MGAGTNQPGLTRWNVPWGWQFVRRDELQYDVIAIAEASVKGRGDAGF